MHDLILATLPALTEALDRRRYPVLFATVSGSHLYGFASADSDYDVRGAHLLPLRDVLGMHQLRETIEHTDAQGVDLVTHDLRKFCRLLLKKNGYILEQLYSPLVIRSSPVHAALLALAPGTLTRHHYWHYRGFAANEWRLLLKEPERRLKRVLYIYRVLLTGIHLLRTGAVEAHLPTLLAHYPEHDRVQALIVTKQQGGEQAIWDEAQVERWHERYEALHLQLATAYETCRFPEEVPGLIVHEINNVVVSARLSGS